MTDQPTPQWDNDWGLDTPWEIRAKLLHNSTGYSAEKCRDYVALQWLEDGDTQPLGRLARVGRLRGFGLRYIAETINPSSEHRHLVPFKLITVPRKKRARAV